MNDDLKDLLSHLVTSPKESEVLIDFDIKEKVFILTIPIYSSKSPLPKEVREYAEARKQHVFQPHSTYFRIESDRMIHLVQKIPFRWGIASMGSRQEILDFLHVAKKCHRMLYEIALEEKVRQAHFLSEEV